LSKPLVIVESPAKARTIGKFLGKDYEVQASMGHVRDLPRSGLHVYPEKDFEADWEPIKERTKVVADLRKALGKADTLYLATDPDREGEAIAWHLVELLQTGRSRGMDIKRVVFHEITKDAIREAFEHPSVVNQDLVNAYRARRILDRLVGYKLSELLWRKLTRGLSAGRVQSVSVKLVVEREREIRAFVPDEYWKVLANFGQGEQAFVAEFKRLDGEAQALTTAAGAREVLARSKADDEALPEPDRASDGRSAVHLGPVRGGPFTLSSLKQAPKRVSAKPPFKTSTLQQAAAGRYGFTAKRTMRVAQQLYEGIELPGEGAVGLITYMRTDSFNIAGAARNAARDLVRQQFGDRYLPDKPNAFRGREGAQEAHEAIRPTDPHRAPDAVRHALTEEQWKLYDLIWRRFIACQMSPAEYLVTTLELLRNGAAFNASGRVTTFPGFTAVWGADKDAGQGLPALQEGQELLPTGVVPSQHFTTPPRRYTEASLVKALEEAGIGRPSTYASILSTIVDRKYVDHGEEAEQCKLRGQLVAQAAEAAEAAVAPPAADAAEADDATEDAPDDAEGADEDDEAGPGPRQRRQSAFFATHLGEVTTDLLEPQFGDIVNTQFTAQLEADLDHVAEGKRPWLEVIEDFWKRFEADLEAAKEGMQHYRSRPMAVNDLTCDKVDEDGKTCGAPMVILFNRGGAYLGCSRYPDCSNNVPLSGVRSSSGEMTEHTCRAKDEAGKLCGRPMEKKVNRWGRPFLACTGFKEKLCKGAVSLSTKGEPLWPVESTVACPNCGRMLNVKRSRRGKFLACPGFPKCRGTLNLPACPHESRGGKPCGLPMTEPAPGGKLRCREHDECTATPPAPRARADGAADGEPVGKPAHSRKSASAAAAKAASPKRKAVRKKAARKKLPGKAKGRAKGKTTGKAKPAAAPKSPGGAGRGAKQPDPSSGR
jgi:DNA topoisomerase-1